MEVVAKEKQEICAYVWLQRSNQTSSTLAPNIHVAFFVLRIPPTHQARLSRGIFTHLLARTHKGFWVLNNPYSRLQNLRKKYKNPGPSVEPFIPIEDTVL
jgi:hypothetical protein